MQRVQLAAVQAQHERLDHDWSLERVRSKISCMPRELRCDSPFHQTPHLLLDDLDKRPRSVCRDNSPSRDRVQIQYPASSNLPDFRSSELTSSLSGRPGPGDKIIQSIWGSTLLWNSFLLIGVCTWSSWRYSPRESVRFDDYHLFQHFLVTI